MKKDILERYERNEESEIVINISASKIEDLYNDFDKRSPFLKKDLDENLVEYMIDCVNEIDGEEFVICFNLDSEASDESISRVKNSVKNFFVYMKELEYKKMKEMARTSVIFLAIGLVLATFSILANQSDASQDSIVAGIMAEGLTVAAWVSFWEALATFLIKWIPHKKKISLYEKIAAAKVLFGYSAKKTQI